MENKYKILVIEDEKSILNFITKHLELSGYRVLKAAAAKDGLLMCFSECPDVIVLDLGLPDMDGYEVIQRVREQSELPILVVSARTTEQEKVKMLDAGADDYMTKPFGTSELIARIRNCLKHQNRIGTAIGSECGYRAGNLRIDYEKRLISLAGEEIHVTPVEYKILCSLSKQAGKVVTYHSLLKEIWGPYADDDNKILRVNMANIRRKLEQNPGEPEYIFTELGVGYRMRSAEES